MQIFLQTRNEFFRVAAAVSLSHIVRLNPSLFSFVMEKIGIKAFAAALTDES